MGDLNFIKNEVSFGGDFSLNPKNWFKKRYTKESVKLLFIDDDDMPIADNLRKSGWDVKKMKDVRDINCDGINNRQIIFVDYEGVGLAISSKHQGIGLAKLLKEEYKESKYIVLYTSQKSIPIETAFNDALSLIDDKLPKDADETDFLEVINKALSKLKK